MKMIKTILICVSMNSGRLMAQEQYTGQTIEQILELPEEEIDLGIACLVLAKDAYPQLDIARFDYMLDYMVDRIDRLMQEAVDPESRIGMMNTYLYRAGWWNDSLTFTYDMDDLKAAQKENRFFKRIPFDQNRVVRYHAYAASRFGGQVRLAHEGFAQRPAFLPAVYS